MIMKSSTSFRNDYEKISVETHESGEPIFIAKNGEGGIIANGIDAFDKHEQMIVLKLKLALSRWSQISGEPTVSIAEARKRLERKYSDVL